MICRTHRLLQIAAGVMILLAAFFAPHAAAQAETEDHANLLRLLVAVESTSLLYFAIMPANFPQSASGYMQSLASFALALISTLPGLFGATYFIFNFGAAKKACLTLLTMGHLVVFIPLQMLLHALLLQISVMFMPLLYILFALAPDILIIIAFYSWGMSWNFDQ